MDAFVVEEDRWGYHVIVDTGTGTHAAYTTHRPRAEAIVARLNDEPAEPATETIRLPDAVEAAHEREHTSRGRVRAGAGVSGWRR